MHASLPMATARWSTAALLCPRRAPLAVALASVLTGCFDSAPDVSADASSSTTADASSSTGAPPAADSSSGPASTSTGMETSSSSTSAPDSSSEGDSSSSGEPAPLCGDERQQGEEECDGAALPTDCLTLGFDGGELGCTDDCQLDITTCTYEGMVVVPGGAFEMGSIVQPDEQPIRDVELPTFFIDATEVTVAAYQQCVTAKECTPPDTAEPYCNWGVAGRDDHPVNCVAWLQAQQYCAWADGASKRLPTEAEWEKAARGTDARTYPWGNVPTPDCNYAVMDEFGYGCGLLSTHEVGQLPLGASPYGALDMAGNVWEWTADWYGAYDRAETVSPTGPAMGSDRVVRGGGWSYSEPQYFRASVRHYVAQTFNDAFIGFRCVREG